ncbi:pentapeptide repeat-containing protein [uncultured Winogradskyella sp.]|uniref:pentapeptide repeat-containing protein n=1 Tax=uncultured Winogradskyella sp. TaxID=395353 RepID=UPI002609F94D|nr:pentapeptide repeat-containing protein [uncultured Winogradskyella sp.]
MSLKGKKYNNQSEFTEDFKGKDLSMSEFIKCDLSGVSFSKAILTGSKFKGCFITHQKSIDFKEAILTNSTFEECVFPGIVLENTSFENSNISYCDFRNGSLIGCSFDESTIENLNISKCRIHLSSFLNSKIISIQYLPETHIPYTRGLKLFSKKRQIYRTVFINYNSHLDFTEFCHTEARKDKLYASAAKKGFFLREISILLVALFGILTDYGTSLQKWFMCVISIIALYAIGILNYSKNLDMLGSIKLSIKFFFNLDSITNHSMPFYFVTESILGFFMLGVLVTLLTTKIISN